MNNKGFTLMELMVVVAIIAIFLVMVISGIGKSRVATRNNIREADIQDIRLALEEYKFKCGEYPATLLSSTSNGDCPAGFSLGDVLVLPTVPKYSETPAFYSELSYTQSFNGYYYNGLSTRSSGPCFEYHLAVPLEAVGDDVDDNSLLDDDHDCTSLERPFDSICEGSYSGLSDDHARDDDGFGLYDFRSANNCN